MRLSDISKQTKTVFAVVVIAAGLYLYLTFGALSISIRDLFFDAIKAVLSFLFPQYTISPTIRAIIFDVLVLFIGAGAFWIFYFSQFVLPVKELPDRISAFIRLLSSIAKPGPAIFIQDGEQKQEGFEKRDRKGAGVILLDTASAAVLSNRGAFTRAVGPGLVFTQKNETIQSTLDLHTQRRTLGPKPEESPFAPKADDENEEDYDYRQRRRKQTSGLTRDGIEVVPNISVVFRLKPSGGAEDYEKTKFGFNPESVRLAVTREGINPKAPNDAGSYKIDWDWLPVHVAADVWREYLRKFTMNELFEITSHEISQTGPTRPRTIFSLINFLTRERLTSDRVPKLDETGKVVGRHNSEEYDLMNEHGIEVLGVSITTPLVEEEKKLIERWKATWLQRAKAEQKEIEKNHRERTEAGQKSALQDFSFTIAGPLDKELNAAAGSALNGKPDLVHSLELLALGTLDYLRQDQPQGPVIDDPKSDVIEIIDWLRSHRNGKG